VGAAESLFRSTCTIVAPSVAATNGNPTYDYSALLATFTSGVRCEIQGDSSRDGIEFSREFGRTRYTGWFRATQSINLRHRILWTPRGSSTQKTLEVVSPPRDPSGFGDHVEVTLEETN
jgi:hypothetical protein